MAASKSIAHNSLGTYASAGWNKFLGFCHPLGIDATNPPIPYTTDLTNIFYIYMLEDAKPPLQPDTANQYIAHLAYALKYFQLIPPDAVIRTDPTHKLHQAYHKDFRAHLHDRDTCTIPMTFPLLCEKIREATRMSTPPSQWLLASLSPDCPLRPGEYLKQNGKIDHPNLLTAKETYGWFKTVAYRADQISE